MTCGLTLLPFWWSPHQLWRPKLRRPLSVPLLPPYRQRCPIVVRPTFEHCCSKAGQRYLLILVSNWAASCRSSSVFAVVILACSAWASCCLCVSPMSLSSRGWIWKNVCMKLCGSVEHIVVYACILALNSLGLFDTSWWLCWKNRFSCDAGNWEKSGRTISIPFQDRSSSAYRHLPWV